MGNCRGSCQLPAQFARHEKPHAVQDKTEGGQPARRSSGIVASRWLVAAVYDRRNDRRTSSPSFASEDVDLGASLAKLELDEINDHPREQSRRQNSAYRHRNMKGAFGNGGALRFYVVVL